MKPVEVAFFAVAFLLPLVGGAGLLYFLMRAKPGDDAKREGAPDESPPPPQKD